MFTVGNRFCPAGISFPAYSAEIDSLPRSVDSSVREKIDLFFCRLGMAEVLIWHLIDRAVVIASQRHLVEAICV